MAALAVEVTNAARMMIRAAASVRGLEVSFADGRSGLIAFGEIPEIGELSKLAALELPNPYEIHLRNVEGEAVELPWDFARHFCDPAYRQRAESIAVTGRGSMGQRIRQLRDSQSMTQDQLARSAGIGRITLIRIENWQRSPRYETLVRLGEALAIPPAELLG